MSPRSVLITGASGYLGRTLVALVPTTVALHLIQYRTSLTSVPARSEVHTLDLADQAAVTMLFEKAKPDLVIHAAATMDTALLERSVVEPTKHIVDACRHSGARLVHVSTDMVFDGEHAPYSESAPLQPITPYGQAKAKAEVLVGQLPVKQSCIVRTSLISGTHPFDPRSEWVVASLQNGQPLTLFVDELRCPIWVEDLAAALWELGMAQEVPPIIHVAGREVMSRYALGVLIAHYAGVSSARIQPAYSRSHTQRRPRDLRLDVQLAAQYLHRQPCLMSELYSTRLTERV